MTHPSHTHPVRLRRARPGDLQQIMRIERDGFESEAEQFGPGQIRRLIGNPRAIVSVAVRRGETVLGWAAGLVRCAGARTSGRIYALAVHPDAQGMRIGRRLLNRTVRSLRAQGVARIYLEVRAGNPAAVALYRKAGFEELKRLAHYYARGRHALRMRLGA